MMIRKAGPGDAERVQTIYNQAVHKRFCTAHLEEVTKEEYSEKFLEHDHERFAMFVIEITEGIAGWVSLSPYRGDRQALNHVAEVSYYVHNDHKGKGYGTQLLNYAIEIAPAYSFSILIAILLDRNTASIGLLKKFKFSEWGRMPGIAQIGEEEVDHLYYGLKL